MSDFASFQKRAKELGVEAVDHGNGHWQVKGIVTVNYYPSTGTIYVNGTVKGTKGDEAKVFAMAKDGALPHAKVKVRRHPNKSQRNRLLRINPRCRWCGRLLDEHTATLDHVIPISRGGSNRPDNLTLACDPCNKDKGSSLAPLKQEKKNQRVAF